MREESPARKLLATSSLPGVLRGADLSLSRQRSILMLAFIVVLTFAGLSVTAGCRHAAQEAGYVEGELLVKFRVGVSEERRAEIHRILGNRLVESWPAIRWYRLLLKEGLSVPEGIRQYRSFPEVENAEANFRRHLGLPPQDPPTRLPQ